MIRLFSQHLIDLFQNCVVLIFVKWESDSLREYIIFGGDVYVRCRHQWIVHVWNKLSAIASFLKKTKQSTWKKKNPKPLHVLSGTSSNQRNPSHVAVDEFGKTDKKDAKSGLVQKKKDF